jgi:MFS family permease
MGVISTIVYCLVPVIYVKVVFLIFQAVFYSSLFPLLNAVAVHENVEASGTVLGTTISVSIVGLIVFQPLTGYLMEWFGKNGINYLLLGVAVIVFAAIFILFKLVSTKYKTRFKILKY